MTLIKKVLVLLIFSTLPISAQIAVDVTGTSEALTGSAIPEGSQFLLESTGSFTDPMGREITGTQKIYTFINNGEPVGSAIFIDGTFVTPANDGNTAKVVTRPSSVIASISGLPTAIEISTSSIKFVQSGGSYVRSQFLKDEDLSFVTVVDSNNNSLYAFSNINTEQFSTEDTTALLSDAPGGNFNNVTPKTNTNKSFVTIFERKDDTVTEHVYTYDFTFDGSSTTLDTEELFYVQSDGSLAATGLRLRITNIGENTTAKVSVVAL